MPEQANGTLERVRELIHAVGVAMTTTINDGQLTSRPMLPLQLEGDQSVYFLTHESSEKVRQLSADARVNLALVGTNGEYLSISGRAELSKNAALIEALWHPTYRAWFPAGRDDPDMVVLRVTIEHADYWETPTSRVVRLYGVARAVITGQPYETAPRQSVEGPAAHRPDDPTSS